MDNFVVLQALVKDWPFAVGALAFVTAILTAVGKWQSIRKSRAEIHKLVLESDEKSRAKVLADSAKMDDQTAVVFDHIRVADNNSNWIERDIADLYTRGWEYGEIISKLLAKWPHIRFFHIRENPITFYPKLRCSVA